MTTATVNPSTTTNLQALNDRVIVRPDPLAEQQGGVYVPEEAREGIVSRTGIIVSVGPFCKQLDAGAITGLRLPAITPGRRVYFNKYHGLEIEYKGEKLLSLREEELLALDPVAPSSAMAQDDVTSAEG